MNLLRSIHRSRPGPERTPEQLHAGYLTMARLAEFPRHRAEEIYAELSSGPSQHSTALRLLAGEAVDDLAAKTLTFTRRSGHPRAAHCRPSWVRRRLTAVSRCLPKPFGGAR